MPSSLEADGVKGYLLFARLVIWMQLSDRVARGEFDFWCILHINLLLQEVILFFSVTARNRKDFKHNASRLLDIQLLQTLHSDDSYVLRPEE